MSPEPAAFSVHGVLVHVHDDAVPSRPAATLLDGFPRADAHAAPDLRVQLELCAEVVPWEEEVEALEPIFFHSHVQAYAHGRGVTLCDRASLLHINDDYDSVTGRIAAASLTDPETFVSLPMFLSFITALRPHGLFHLHAGAVELPDGRGCLIVGTGGAGKSTLTIGFAVMGCRYLGDDVQLLRLTDDGVEALAFPRPFHVGQSTSVAFPELVELLEPRAKSTKKYLDHRRAFPNQQTWRTTPLVALFPRVAAHESTRLAALSGADTLAALMESGAFFAVDHLPKTREHLTALQRVATAARGYELVLGEDFLGDPRACLDEVLAELAI